MSKKVILKLDPKIFYSEALMSSLKIKNKNDKKQFLRWASLFKDDVKELKYPNGETRYQYYNVSMIVFNRVDAETIINEDGSINLYRGDLKLFNNSDDEFPTETWCLVGTYNFPEILDVIVDEYNNKDNRYFCRVHGKILYKSHDGKWTKK